MAGETTPTKKAVSADFKRILDLEQHVLGCIDAAAEMAQELSNVEVVDQQRAALLCAKFMDNIKAGQALIHEAVTRSSGERAFEANSYQSMAKAHLGVEKAGVVSLHLSQAYGIMRDTGHWQGRPLGSSEEAAAAALAPTPALQPTSATTGAAAGPAAAAAATLQAGPPAATAAAVIG